MKLKTTKKQLDEIEDIELKIVMKNGVGYETHIPNWKSKITPIKLLKVIDEELWEAGNESISERRIK